MQFRPALDSHEAVGDTEFPSNLLSSPFQEMGLEMCAKVMGDPERGISSFLPSKCVPLYLAFKSGFLITFHYVETHVRVCMQVCLCVCSCLQSHRHMIP